MWSFFSTPGIFGLSMLKLCNLCWCVYIDTGRAPDFAARFEKRWGTLYTNRRLVGLFLSPSRCPHSPRTLVNLLRHAHICWELSQCVIASQAELFYQMKRVKVCWVVCEQGRCLFNFTVSLALRNDTWHAQKSHMRKYLNLTEARWSR